LNVNIRKLSPSATTPTYATDGKGGSSAAFDLYAAADGVIAPGMTAKIPLGISVELPPDHVMIVTARQDVAFSTPLRQPNGIGVIDSDYRGEVTMLFEHVDVPEEAEYGRELITLDGGLHTWDIGLEYEVGSYLIRKGDVVANGIVVPVPRVEFTEVDALSEIVA
jgi:dUTP pyrophosphatase